MRYHRGCWTPAGASGGLGRPGRTRTRTRTRTHRAFEYEYEYEYEHDRWPRLGEAEEVA
ncbi:MAG: hypothetical protein HZA54_16630 [Planctomycetes bacterium]|nr:hypothetical protein [Planctomycetota bacterium]